MSEACSRGNVFNLRTGSFAFVEGGGSAGVAIWWLGGVGQDVGIPFAGEFLLWLLFIQFTEFRRGVLSHFGAFSIFPCLDESIIGGDILHSFWGPGAVARGRGRPG